MSPVRAVSGLRRSGKGRDSVLYFGHFCRFPVPQATPHARRVSVLVDPRAMCTWTPGADVDDDMSPVYRALRDAGLAYPVYEPTEPTPTQRRMLQNLRMGTMIHNSRAACVADLAEDPHQQREPMIDAAVARAGSTLNPRRRGRPDRINGVVSAMVRRYLAHFMPGPPARFLGAEQPVLDGRVDLVWEHPVAGVFFDEVKSWRTVAASLDPYTWDQITRYTSAGLARHGREVAGVRIITLVHPDRATHVTPAGDLAPLHLSALAPNRLKEIQ